MNGVFFFQLMQYIDNQSGWQEILKNAGIDDKKLYFSGLQYPEEEFYHIVTEAAKHLGITKHKFLEGFGEHISYSYMKFCQPVIKEQWTTLDLLEHLEEFNKKILQMGDHPDKSGKFKSERIDPYTIHIHYSFPRKLCAMLTGLIHGIAKQYRQKVEINEKVCCLKGSNTCHFVITAKKSS